MDERSGGGGWIMLLSAKICDLFLSDLFEKWFRGPNEFQVVPGCLTTTTTTTTVTHLYQSDVTWAEAAVCFHGFLFIAVRKNATRQFGRRTSVSRALLRRFTVFLRNTTVAENMTPFPPFCNVFHPGSMTSSSSERKGKHKPRSCERWDK